MASRSCGPEAIEKAPLSIAVESEAGVVIAARPTTPHTAPSGRGQTIPSLIALHLGNLLPANREGGGQ